MGRRAWAQLALGAAVAAATGAVLAPAAGASPGDLVAQINTVAPCIDPFSGAAVAAGVGQSIAFDGARLYYTNRGEKSKRRWV